MDNLLSNIFEDAFFQAEIRNVITHSESIAKSEFVFTLISGIKHRDVMDMIGHEMLALAQVYVPNSFAKRDFVIQELSSPWNRMFEIKL